MKKLNRNWVVGIIAIFLVVAVLVVLSERTEIPGISRGGDVIYSEEASSRTDEGIPIVSVRYSENGFDPQSIVAYSDHANRIVVEIENSTGRELGLTEVTELRREFYEVTPKNDMTVLEIVRRGSYIFEAEGKPEHHFLVQVR